MESSLNTVVSCVYAIFVSYIVFRNTVKIQKIFLAAVAEVNNYY